MEDLRGLLKEYFTDDEEIKRGDVYENIFKNIYNSYFTNEENYLSYETEEEKLNEIVENVFRNKNADPAEKLVVSEKLLGNILIGENINETAAIRLTEKAFEGARIFRGGLEEIFAEKIRTEEKNREILKYINSVGKNNGNNRDNINNINNLKYPYVSAEFYGKDGLYKNIIDNTYKNYENSEAYGTYESERHMSEKYMAEENSPDSFGAFTGSGIINNFLDYTDGYTEKIYEGKNIAFPEYKADNILKTENRADILSGLKPGTDTAENRDAENSFYNNSGNIMKNYFKEETETTPSAESLNSLIESYVRGEGGDYRQITNTISPAVNIYSQGSVGEIDIEDIADRLAELISEAVSREADGFYS